MKLSRGMKAGLWGETGVWKQVTLEKHRLSADGAEDFLVRFSLGYILVDFVRLLWGDGFAEIILQLG